MLEGGQRKCRELIAKYPESVALLSVAKQINYLIGLEQGVQSDRSRLKDITIGVLTAREHTFRGNQMDFVPMNELESALLASSQQLLPVRDFARLLYSSKIALLSASEVQTDGAGFEPVIFDKQGVNMLAAFTTKERTTHLLHIAKFCLIMKGSDVLRRMPEGYGLVINPGLTVGLEISPSGIAEILDEFGGG